jgi:SdrD B-like domain/Secretion system C-terminal sorting domain
MKRFLLSLALLLLIFTAKLSAQTVSLGNSVWWDFNDNGKKDFGEPMAQGYTVRLYQDNDEDAIADVGFTTLSAVTDVNGKYLFSNLAPGKYFVRLTAGASHYKTTVYGGDPDNDIAGDNNGYSQNLATFHIYTQTITLAPGTEPDGSGATNTNTNNTVDMGIWKANGLGDFVWLDNNANGVQESGEPGLANVQVKLRDASGTLLETTTTDANGYYFFHDPSGLYSTNNYQVEFVTPNGYIPTTANTLSDDNLDSDPVNGFITGITVVNGTWDHSFDAGFRPAVVMPVTLLNFNALLNNNKISLNWSTANEINIDRFLVEKSTDGINYTSIAIVLANAGLGNTSNYSYWDNSTMQPALIYYRLRMVDADGKFKLSDVRVIRTGKQVDNNISITTYPNPVINTLRVTIPASWQNKKVSYELFNTAGNSIKKIQATQSSQTENISVSNLSAGVYFIKVMCNGQTATQKLIKN